MAGPGRAAWLGGSSERAVLLLAATVLVVWLVLDALTACDVPGLLTAWLAHSLGVAILVAIMLVGGRLVRRPRA